jgi:peptide/nickel transport system permease protein
MLRAIDLRKSFDLRKYIEMVKSFDLREYISILKYVSRRLMIMPILLTGISVLIFAMFSMLSPYERAALYVKDVPTRQVGIDEIIKKYRLDDPFLVQYWNWMVGIEDPDTGEIEGGVLRGDLGWSVSGKSPVTEVIGRRFPASAELLLWSVVPMIGLAVWMGVYAASNQNKFIDQILRLSAIAGWSIPSFVIGLLLLMYFNSGLSMFPPGRLSLTFSQLVISDEFVQYTTMHTIDALLNFRLDIFVDALRHLVLPVISLSIVNWALLLRITRSAMLDTLRQDYITTAWAKGLPKEKIINQHALRNALIPVITFSGLTLISLFNSVVITETIFNIPGIGSFLADSILDPISLLGLSLVIAVILVIGNLIVDVLYAIVDPRIRLE